MHTSWFCCGGLALSWFVDLKNLIRGDVFQRLPDSAGPANFNLLCDVVFSQSEMNTLVARGKVAARSRNCRGLQAARRHNCDLGANSVAIAFVSDKLQEDPVVLRLGFIVENMNRPVVSGHNGIETAVVVEISDGQSA